jgi:hypothetical protein
VDIAGCGELTQMFSDESMKQQAPTKTALVKKFLPNSNDLVIFPISDKYDSVLV